MNNAKTLPETEQRFIEYYQRSGLSTKELTDKMDYRKKWKRANLQQLLGICIQRIVAVIIFYDTLKKRR